jgi:hypothetical protein
MVNCQEIADPLKVEAVAVQRRLKAKKYVASFQW